VRAFARVSKDGNAHRLLSSFEARCRSHLQR
jgi:hypothetical protein